MAKKPEPLQSAKLCEVIIEGMQEKKAQEIVLLDLRRVKNAIADYFILCTGTSDTHIDAIARSVEEFTWKQSGQDAWHKEGIENKEWILLDYVEVVVNVFNSRARDFYALEQLWGDAELKEIESAH